MKNNIIQLCDSYKLSHSSQYPSNMVSMYGYMESRGGLYPETIFVGLQYYIKEYLMKVPSKEQVKKAHKRATAHGVPFDREGWDYIAELGYLPVRIKAVKEGALVPVKNVLVTIESTDPKVPWIAGFLETILMKVWYPTTIATKSYYVKKMLEKYGLKEWAQFAYHNFGDRGSSSVESAAIGGFAHSTQFMGTDNFNSLDFAEEYYGADIASSYSVFATEHSTTTSYGKDFEEQFVYDKLIENPDAPIMSFVADSYDVYKFTEFCTAPDSRIRKIIESRPHQKLVLRPDSGDPIEVIDEMLHIMNVNGIFDSVDGKLLSSDFGILWGDGITPETIENILREFTEENSLHFAYAAENFVFGSGGDIMSNVTRDTQKFAVKCSSITVREEDCNFAITTKERDVYKDPITDPGKTSKKGKVSLFRNTLTGEYQTRKLSEPCDDFVEVLETVFENGELIRECTLDDIREMNRSYREVHVFAMDIKEC